MCLDVAVDHRIRKLFKPVLTNLTERSEHVSCIEAQGEMLNRSCAEIRVTAQLAGPAFKGGIAIALQQPRCDHPFDMGLDAVVEDCKTLRALHDIFIVDERVSESWVTRFYHRREDNLIFKWNTAMDAVCHAAYSHHKYELYTTYSQKTATIWTKRAS
jgi:hypothetical protein